MDPSEPSLARGARVGGYEIEERIGVGGFGEVFRARHPLIGREVAIKVLHARYSADPEAVARFVSEARAVNRISHPGIVEVFDFEKLDDGRELFVMELIRGRTLREVLAERGRLPLVEALPILRGVAEAVDAAHAAGVAHRDLKPENIFVTDAGGTKLIDFGLAKLTRDADAAVTETGSVFGTPLYMSPEQCRGKALDTRTDLYSFGALAYHVLAGSPPFGGDAIELALHHLNDRPEPPSKRCPGLSRQIDRVVLALLAKDPADRPASLGLAIRALEGSATLRVRRVRVVKRAALVVLPLAATGAVIGYVATRESPAAPSGCVSGASRIAPIWNGQVRDLLASRMTAPKRRDLDAIWGVMRDELDRRTTAWSKSWDDACRSPDRDSIPLLYGERVTCLETVLLDLRSHIGHAVAITAVDVDQLLFHRGAGGRVLEDCANPAVLDAQVPAPSAAVRDRVSQLMLEGDRIAAAAWIAVGKRDSAGVDRETTRLDAVNRQIEALDRPSAAMPILLRVQLLTAHAADFDATRRPAARLALDDAIGRIEASRDDVALAHAYLAEAHFERFTSADPDSTKKLEAALDRAARAVERAGHPLVAENDLAELRAELAMDHAHFREAITLFRAAVARMPAQTLDAEWEWLAPRGVVLALARSGRLHEAVDEARLWVERVTKIFGAGHPNVTGAQLYIFMTLHLSGDLDGALVVNAKIHDAEALLPDGPEHWEVWGRMYRLEVELELGRKNPEADHYLGVVRGTVPPKQNPDGFSTARRAGLYAIVEYAATRPSITSPAQFADNAALLAYYRGDRALMATLAAKVHCGDCRDWMRWSRWLSVIADGKIERLAAIEADYGTAIAAAMTGIVLAELGRWDEAKQKLEAARAMPGWEYQAELSDLDAWLGLARLRAGDTAGARESLEEAVKVLSIWHNGIEGFSYMRPVAQLALADLVWPEDRVRARWLAETASKGFARLGKFREGERARATRWLAQH